MAAPQSIIETHATHLEGWIQSCNENHGSKCQVEPIAGRPSHHIPDWVIDTEDGCIVRGCSVQRYAALSYVWNHAVKENIRGRAAIEKRLVLRKDNLANLCRPGFLRSRILERVPVVIRNAMDFVQLSGFRYLWVDSLCIVQHDDTTRDRVGLMNEIYSGAYFTIIAAASTKGLYGNKLGHLPEKSITVRYLHSKLLCSHWASRGWTFQEQLLSKRSIVFLDDVCFWDCQREVQWPRPSMNARTDSLVHTRLQRISIVEKWRPPSSSRHPIEQAALERVTGELSSRTISEDLATLSSVPDFKFYIELICRYSNRNLTYDQDALPAFSGVLDALSRRSFLGGFICGLPALFLDSALLWQPLLRARRRSPVGKATRIAPMAPLPSWSWAGWQCLVDPDSLRSGLDYMTEEFEFYPYPMRTGRTSWRIFKLINWSTLSDDGSFNTIDEPALLQSFKTAWEKPDHKSLPTEWSRDDTGAFVHASKPTVSYRYPLPTQNKFSTMTSDRNTSLLFCTTKMASLRVRRVLIQCGFDKAERNAGFGRPQPQSFVDTPVFETDVYKFKPQLHDFCPVITLEDEAGRWAGAMAMMENKASVQSGSELKMIAISTGSAFQKDVAASYPEKIDSSGYWCYGPRTLLDSCRFRPLDSHGGPEKGGGSGKLSAADDTRRSLDAGIDVGPFAFRCYRPGISNTSPAVESTATAPAPAGSEQSERYHFYNVLWVETIEGVMYRKAAGRVPKDVWELNCGDHKRIVLG